MKKVMFFLILACLAAGFLFAQDYTVQTVTGRVFKGTGHDRADIIEGEVFTEETIVSVSAGALLVFTDGEHTFTITPGYTGRVIDAPPVLRIRRGGRGPAVRAERRSPVRSTVVTPAPAAEEIHHDDVKTEEPSENLILHSNGHIEIKITVEAGTEKETEAGLAENH